MAAFFLSLKIDSILQNNWSQSRIRRFLFINLEVTATAFGV